jgi:hypothetical protein
MRDEHMRLEALRLAMPHVAIGGEPYDETLQRAEAFYQFLRGAQSEAKQYREVSRAELETLKRQSPVPTNL